MLVTTYIVCQRLSVMQRQARLPEIFDQIAQFTSDLEFGSRILPPPLEKWNLARSWHFGFWLSRTPHTPAPPIENWNLARSWHFGFWLFRSPPSYNFKTLIFFFESKSDLFQITPPPNGNLARSWHFGFWLPRTLPPPLKFRQILVFGFWLSRSSPPQFQNSNILSWVQIWPFPDHPPSKNWNLGRSWHFGFWLSRPPPMSGSWSMWRLIAVSPKDTISFLKLLPGQFMGTFFIYHVDDVGFFYFLHFHT